MTAWLFGLCVKKREREKTEFTLTVARDTYFQWHELHSQKTIEAFFQRGRPHNCVAAVHGHSATPRPLIQEGLPGDIVNR